MGRLICFDLLIGRLGLRKPILGTAEGMMLRRSGSELRQYVRSALFSMRIRANPRLFASGGNHNPDYSAVKSKFALFSLRTIHPNILVIPISFITC